MSRFGLNLFFDVYTKAFSTNVINFYKNTYKKKFRVDDAKYNLIINQVTTDSPENKISMRELFTKVIQPIGHKSKQTLSESIKAAAISLKEESA